MLSIYHSWVRSVNGRSAGSSGFLKLGNSCLASSQLVLGLLGDQRLLGFGQRVERSACGCDGFFVLQGDLICCGQGR